MSSYINFVNVYPSNWPEEKKLEVYPGDLECFAIPGVGISGPFPIRPWGNPVEDDPSEYYGFQPIKGHPIKDASRNEPSGGIVYFHGTPGRDDFFSLIKLLGVRSGAMDYAAFVDHSNMPVEDNYLIQMRLVSKFALKYVFHAIEEENYDSFPDQRINIGDALWNFIQDQQDRWGTSMGSRELDGVMGGDGDFAKEELAFGMMVENEYNGIYRIWSRAWLVTK